MSRIDTPALRKRRGAFFTPEPIADHLAEWAVGENPGARILDPTCGEAVFLLAAGRHLRSAGCAASDLRDRLFGVDLHEASLKEARSLLHAEGLDADLRPADFFSLSTPAQLDCPFPEMDAVIGNPPFVRYQRHVGATRKRAMEAALAQSVRLSGLASSWAPLLAHACGFLKPEGRLAMVLPAELLTVGYAEPVRRWLLGRFERVHLVFFEQLQFADAMEKVVLVLAGGQGPSSGAFALHYVQGAEDLSRYLAYDGIPIPTVESGKWSDLLIATARHRNLFRKAVKEHYVALEEYGRPELGTVTGANGFFTLAESDRIQHGLAESQFLKTSPPGTRHLRGATFTEADWRRLRERGERVWLLRPEVDDDSPALARYIAAGERQGIDEAYKCRIRDPWWRPPAVPAPDLFFTYMSHHCPRLVANAAKVTFLNSMHGIRLRAGRRGMPKAALPLLALNSVTMIGAELGGRSYGGGVLKMEPREAASLPVPALDHLHDAWEIVKDERAALDAQLREGRWTSVVDRIDKVLLCDVMGISVEDAEQLALAAMSLRERRTGRRGTGDGDR